MDTGSNTPQAWGKPLIEAFFARWGPLLLILLVVALYLPTLGHGFVWDDHDLIPHDGQGQENFGLLELFQPYWSTETGDTSRHTAYVRPLVTLTFGLESALYGGNPAGFHGLNILLHASATVLLFWLLRGLIPTGSRPWALFFAALFAVFPTQVEATAWIAGRTDLLATAFGLIALLCQHRARGHDRWPTAAALAVLAAILSKETGWMFGILLVLQDRLLKEPVPWRVAFQRWRPLMGAFAIGLAARVLSLQGQPAISLQGQLPGWLLPVRVATTTGHSLLLLLWPWNPSLLPATRSLEPPSSPLLWLGFALLFLGPWVAWRGVRQGRRVAAFAVCWILLGLLPVLQFSPLSTPSPVAERYFYMPLGGMMLLATDVSARLRAKGTGWKVVSSILLAVLMGASIWTSLKRIPEWASDRTLWGAEVRRHGLRHPLTALNYGLACQIEGDGTTAEAVWREALRRGVGGGSPTYYRIGLELIQQLLHQRAYGQAEGLATQLLGSGPRAGQKVRLEALRQQARAGLKPATVK